MAQLSDDCFAHGGRLMPMAEALALLDERVVAVEGNEEIALRRARGRTLSEDVIAEREVPTHDNSAVDGYAFSWDRLQAGGDTRLAIANQSVAAGHPAGRPADPGEASRIFTGAVMPAGLDTVAMQEDCTVEDGHVAIPPGLVRGDNRRHAGEDVRAGATVLRAGHRMRPQDIGLTASVGRTELVVFRRLSVAVFSTGDEVVEPGTPLPDGAIYDANRYALAAMAEALDATVTDLGILPDDETVVRDTLAAAADGHDLIITSGGVSVGEEDHVRAAVEAIGKLHFWRLAIKPGRPLAMGQVAGVPFVGLPGNPAAAMVTFLRFVRPLILRLSGSTDATPVLFRVRADFDHRKKAARREFVRARLIGDSAGGFAAVKFERDGAGILTSMVEADGLVELPEDLTDLRRGTEVDFLPFSEVLS
jgi:molybdopterin molybdotransferase